MLQNRLNSRLQWTLEVIYYLIQQENALKLLKQERNILSWKIISRIINQMFPRNSRTGKQCRERYTNYVKFKGMGTNMTHWTYEQDLLLFNKFVFFGPKWVKIANFLCQKSENCLKNRFYGMIRKIDRRIKKYYKENNKKIKKIMKPQFLVKILESDISTQFLDQIGKLENLEFQTNLKDSIIKLATNHHIQDRPDDKQLSDLIEQLEKFSNLRKSLKKNKKINIEKIENIKKQRYLQIVNFQPEGQKICLPQMKNCLSLQERSISTKNALDQATPSQPKIIQTIIIKSPEQIQTPAVDMSQFKIIPVFWVPIDQNLWVYT